jgi:hypothetical protein
MTDTTASVSPRLARASGWVVGSWQLVPLSIARLRSATDSEGKGAAGLHPMLSLPPVASPDTYCRQSRLWVPCYAAAVAAAGLLWAPPLPVVCWPLASRPGSRRPSAAGAAQAAASTGSVLLCASGCLYDRASPVCWGSCCVGVADHACRQWFIGHCGLCSQPVGAVHAAQVMWPCSRAQNTHTLVGEVPNCLRW